MKRWFATGLALLVIAIGVILFYQSAAFNSRSGDDAPIYSVRRHDPYGIAALHDLLTERGISVRTLEQASLEPADHGTLIQVLPIDASFRQVRFHLPTQQLVDWIGQGNSVVQFSRAPTELMTHYKIQPSTQPSSKNQNQVQQYEAHGDAPDKTPADVLIAQCDPPASYSDKRLLLWSPMIFADGHQPGRWKALARLSRRGNPAVAGELRIGAGKLVVVGAPTPALNGALGSEANLDFLLDLVGTGPVILDEWSHGLGHEATIVGFLHDAGLLPILVQLAFLAGMYVWSTSGVRRTSEQAPARQRSSIEQVETLGFLYSRSLSPEVIFNRINTEVIRRLAEAFHCQPPDVNARMPLLPAEQRSKFEQLFARLDQAQPAHRARCQNCGYDLAKNETGRCPECGAMISMELRQRIADTSAQRELAAPAGANPHYSRSESALAEILSMSHQLCREVQGDRGLVR